MSTLKARLCVALLDGWAREKNMAYVLLDFVKDGDQQAILECCKALRVKRIDFRQPARAFVALNYPLVGDALWARRPNDACEAMLKRTVGARVGRPLPVGGRANDKLHDWKTVK